ncbi:TPA: hypothetical protein SH495_005522 [Pseudomonas aeruginosa]|nr:hypothetical protein HMPREF2886_01800 [Pseudomonas sp. HMSC066A08]RUE48174.1 hypothetical protein IPC1224_30320 [Pseudomonas aeruginosa]HEH8501044.1 hypothetical protein [Pseudomonas aeruginosa]HEH8694709.1 hypothetical protein [Pseudomonas aeruginosa]HEH8705075.1 hypothetical protein [Pseudomonas aeruginosa]
MREEFEAWLLREHGLESEWQEERNCFKDYPAHLAFKAWQASRAALRVELPEKMEPTRNIYGNLIIGSYNAVLDAVKEALQQAGIEVK